METHNFIDILVSGVRQVDKAILQGGLSASGLLVRLRRIQISQRLTSPPPKSRRINQPEADKSRPDQPSNMKTGSSCELPVLILLKVEWLKWSENGIVLTRKLTSFWLN